MGFRHPARGGPIHGHRQHAQKFGKDCACGSGGIPVARQTDTHTDVLITVLRNLSRWQSNNREEMLVRMRGLYICWGRVRPNTVTTRKSRPCCCCLHFRPPQSSTIFVVVNKRQTDV